MNYVILSHDEIDALAELVSARMDVGWVPCGGVTCNPMGYFGRRFYQAMMKSPTSEGGV